MTGNKTIELTEIAGPVRPTADALSNRALAYLGLGDDGAARASWERALAVDPNNLTAVYNYGLFLWRRGQIDDLECLQRLEMVMAPADWRGPYFRGLVQLERRLSEEALELFAEALALGGEAAVIDPLRHQARAMAAAEKPVVEYVSPFQDAVSMLPARFSPGGEYVVACAGRNVAAEAERGLLVFETDGGALLRRIPLDFTGLVNDIVFFDDGRRLAVAGGVNQLRIVDIITGQCLQSAAIPEESPALQAEASPRTLGLSLSGDGQTLGCRTSGGAVFLWRPASGDWSFIPGSAESSPWHAVFQLNHDGAQILTAHERPGGVGLRISDSQGFSLRNINLGKPEVSELALYPGFGGYLCGREITATASGGALAAMHMHDAIGGAPTRTVYSHSPCSGIYPDADRRYVYAYHYDDCLRFWDMAAGRCIRTMYLHNHCIRLKVVPNGHSFLCPFLDQNIRLEHISEVEFTADWQRAHVPGVAEQAAAAPKFAAHLAAAQRYAATGGIGEALYEIGMARAVPGYGQDAECLALHAEVVRHARAVGIRAVIKNKVIWEGEDYFPSLALSANGRYALTHSAAGSPRLWDLRAGTCVREVNGGFFSNDGVIINTAYDVMSGPEANFIFSGPRPMRQGDLPGDAVFGADFGGTVAGGNDYNSLLALHPDNEHMLLMERTPLCRDVQNLEWVDVLPDGGVSRRPADDVGLAVTGRLPLLDLHGEYRAVLIWADVRTKEPQKIFAFSMPGKNLDIGECCFAPDGRTFLVVYEACDAGRGYYSNVGNTWYLRQLDTYSGVVLKTYLVSDTRLCAAAFSPDGRYVMVRDKNSLLFWENGRDGVVKMLTAPEGVYTARFSPDGGCLGLACDRELELWDFDSLGHMATLKGHTQGITDFRFSRDGRTIVSHGFEQALIVWRIDWEYAFPGQRDFDAGAEPYLRNFLALHPRWSETEFAFLLEQLQNAGYGFVSAGGVRQMLEQLAEAPF